MQGNRGNASACGITLGRVASHQPRDILEWGWIWASLHRTTLTNWGTSCPAFLLESVQAMHAFIVDRLVCHSILRTLVALQCKYRKRALRWLWSAAMASCSTGLLAFLSGTVPIQIINSILSGTKSITGVSTIPTISDGPGWLMVIVALIATVTTLSLIYKFSQVALESWEGPVTVNVNELAKQEQGENNISLLALAEVRRILAWKADPIASEVAINWQQKQSVAPSHHRGICSLVSCLSQPFLRRFFRRRVGAIDFKLGLAKFMFRIPSL